MWGLSTSPSGYHIDTSVAGGNTGRENNGVLLIIRMKDNSLFFYDGGILAQMSDAESAELLAFCRELTGKKVGEKMVINTWFVSHAHDDHFQAFGRFINIHHNHFDLKNVVYNIDLERGDIIDLNSGDKSKTPASKDLREALDVITKWYPNVKYYKPHTGETFNVADVQFEVLYAHEDRLIPDWENKLSFAIDQLADNQIDIKDIGGSYRAGLYKNNDQSDFNDTSTVLKVNFENGVDSILYADLNLAESILTTVYPDSVLKTDIMMVPHHLFDSHVALVQAADAKVYLCPQNKTAVYGADNDYTTPKAVDGRCRDSLRENFAAMKDTLTEMGRTEGVHYDVFWGGSETTVIAIEALGRVLGYTPATRAATTGSYYTTTPANSFEYSQGAWSVTSPASAEYQSVVGDMGDFLDAEDAVAVKVANSQIQFTRVQADEPLVQEGRYLFMSNKYGHIMFFDATAALEIATGVQTGTSKSGSMLLNTAGNSENTYYVDNDGNVILDQSDRHFVIWNLRQYKEATGGTTLKNGVPFTRTTWANFGQDAHNGNGSNAQRSQGTIYVGTDVQKRSNSGSNNYGPYWFCRGDGDPSVRGTTQGSNDFEARYLCYLSDTTFLKNWYRHSLQTVRAEDTATGQGASTTGNRTKFMIEDVGDGTFLIYYKESDSDYRFLVCLSDGTWDVQRYTNKTGVAKAGSVADVWRDLAELKVRLYEYKETDANKRVAFFGNQKYYVSKNATVDSILTDISKYITVFDPDHQN